MSERKFPCNFILFAYFFREASQEVSQHRAYQYDAQKTNIKIGKNQRQSRNLDNCSERTGRKGQEGIGNAFDAIVDHPRESMKSSHQRIADFHIFHTRQKGILKRIANIVSMRIRVNANHGCDEIANETGQEYHPQNSDKDHKWRVGLSPQIQRILCGKLVCLCLEEQGHKYGSKPRNGATEEQKKEVFFVFFVNGQKKCPNF